MSNKVFEKPTCITCHSVDKTRPHFWTCRARSPRENPTWPLVDPDEWCTEHPDFHTYIAAMESQSPQCVDCKHLIVRTDEAEAMKNREIIGDCAFTGYSAFAQHCTCYLFEAKS